MEVMTDRPLREPTFFILAALASGPAHGYLLMSSIEDLSDGRLKLRAGTLYGALDRLKRDGLIEHVATDTADGPPRHSYQLTTGGRARLADEVARLRANAEVGARMLINGAPA